MAGSVYPRRREVAPPILPGTAPWILWRFGDSARIAGIPAPVDVNAFFGSTEDFEAFALGKKRVCHPIPVKI
jgi:hypothetical protein